MTPVREHVNRLTALAVGVARNWSFQR